MAMTVHNLKTAFLMRIGKRSEIEYCWNKKLVVFSCPANWIDKQLTGSDDSIGDIFECIFAHLPSDDPRVWQQVDSHGHPMGDNLLILRNEKDGSFLLRYIPVILTPVLCFYSIRSGSIPIDLLKFASDMKYDTKDCAFLFIKDVARFFDDLKEQVPIAVKDNRNLTSERFYRPFDPFNPIDANNVNYDKYTATEPFYDRQCCLEEFFWKLPEYRYQSECRIIIPNVNYIQGYDPNKKYNPQQNYLEVSLPHLHEYAEIRYLQDTE